MSGPRPERLHARFVLDVHLAKLARHLRMLGFDSLWRPDFEDSELLRISADEGRILLTRDRQLCDRAREDWRHCVDALEPGDQLREVLAAFGLTARARSGRGFLTLCLECNSPILPVKSHQIAERVPEAVLAGHEEFFLCPRCERVYWKGSHWDRMRKWAEELLNPQD